jgi:predicted CopG family antitoxin
MNKTNISYKMHNIAVDDDNYQTLKEFGKVGDSFNDVITRLIKKAKGSELITR